MTRLAGKVAFITGAARGQGRSHAVRMAEEGADIIAVDVLHDLDTVGYPLATPEDLATTVALVEATGRRIVARQADVRDTASLTRALSEGVAELGRVDIVCANAGILSFGAAHEMDESTWLEMIDVNLSGVWRAAQAAVPYLIDQGTGGSIIMTSSTSGYRGYANVPHYVAAKHGIIGLMRTLALELAPHSIRVNSICPTQVDTDMVQNDGIYAVWCPDVADPTPEDFRRASFDAIPMPIPWIESVDVSNAAVFLASDEARYITGVALPVDGGTLLR